jgi:uncharacterized membrane protein
MSFTTPQALLLFLLLPVFVWLVWTPRSNRTPARQAATGPFTRFARPRSGWLGLALRLLIATLLILSLAGTQIVRAVDNLAVIFLVDASDSMSREAFENAEQFAREAITAMGPDDGAGIILFGGNALVEQPVRLFESPDELPSFASQPSRLQTNLAEAIRLSLALFPPDAARRLVVLTDGAVTSGNTQEAVRLAAATGVSVDTVHLPRPEVAEEVILREVNAPARAGQGEAFRLEIAADSTTATTAILRVLGEGGLLHEETVDLQPGTNNFVVRLVAGQPAFNRYRVQLSPAAGSDTFAQNNELSAFTEVTGQPRVLIVAAEDEASPDEAIQLQAALEASGLLVERTTAGSLSSSLADLNDYASVVLVNVNARDLSQRKMETLQSYVRDLGGGLVVIGGPESYGMGGYFETPLEETLPVEMQIKDQERFPAVSMVLVIDRSGSMAASEGGATKIQLAGEGAVRALELLNDSDEMTLITVDTAPSEIIGPLTTADRTEAIERMRQLGAGGGGIYVRSGLEAAAEVLAASDNPVKHIIVLADGADAEQKEGVPELIRDLTADGVTVSMVSIGRGPDTPWLQQMAELGNGRFHFTDAAANLPQIFTQETIAIQRNYLIEERFFPTQVSDSPILTGIDAAPALYGYVGTSPKLTGQAVLETHMGDPLLSVWQYGLGRAVAWTSDATSRWAVDWIRWDQFPTFWGQAVRWSMGNRPESDLEAVVRFDGEEAILSVDAQATDGSFLNGLNLVANMVDPAGRSQTVDLQQVAPGLYEARFTPTAEGAYLVGIGSPDDESLRQSTGWVLGYSPEYGALASDPQLLAALAAQTDGRVIEAADESGPTLVFDHNLAAEPAAQPIWPWLTLLAILLLPFDIAARRLVLTRRDWGRAWAAATGRVRRRSASARERTAAMSSLMQAKERATADRRSPATGNQSPPVNRETGTEAPEPPTTVKADADEEAGIEARETAPDSPGADNAPPEDSTTLAARLRERRQPKR